MHTHTCCACGARSLLLFLSSSVRSAVGPWERGASVQEWEELARQNPYLPAEDGGGDGTGTDEPDYNTDVPNSEGRGDSGGTTGLLDSASGQEDSGGMPDLVVIIVALAVGAALMIGLSVVACWVYRKLHMKKQQARPPHHPRSTSPSAALLHGGSVKLRHACVSATARHTRTCATSTRRPFCGVCTRLCCAGLAAVLAPDQGNWCGASGLVGLAIGTRCNVPALRTVPPSAVRLAIGWLDW